MPLTFTGISSLRAPGLPRGPLNRWLMLLAGLVGLTMLAVRAVGEDGKPATLTDPAQIFALPQDQKALAHPLKMEGRVSYFDPLWKMFWLEQNGKGSYILLGANPPALRTGQRVLLEGQLIPNKGLSADLVSVQVLQDFQSIDPLPTIGHLSDVATFQSRIVAARGYVDSQQFIDEDHVRLALIIDDRPVIGWVKPDNPHAITNWEKKFISLQALYSARFNPTGTETTLEFWIGPERNITVTDTLRSYAAFAAPVTPIDQIHRRPVGAEVRVRGTVESHAGGLQLRVRDETGEIRVYSYQQQRVAIGSVVDVIGHVDVEGSKWVVRAGLFRNDSMGAADEEPAFTAATAVYTRVENIRQLSAEEAAQGRSVHISGLVTWSLPDADFFFLQGLSGGIRVRFDRAKTEPPRLGKFLEIQGVTYNGGLAPAIELRGLTDLGSLSPAAPKPITFDQAITGREDGQWVEMRGFVQRIESKGDERMIYVTSPGGDFVGVLRSAVNFEANPGSLIRIQGVCEAVADAGGQLTGVMLRVPFLHGIAVEDDAPANYFELPSHSLRSLGQLDSAGDLMRVRVTGTAIYSVTGRSLYLEQDGMGVLLLTAQPTYVEPGAHIEAVGILGREGVRPVLRAVQFKVMAPGPAPVPVDLSDPSRLRPELDARLVKLRGTVLDVARQSDEMRLTLQSGNLLFEATLPRTNANSGVTVPLDAMLELTGIYELKFDDTRQIRNFALRLRSPADVSVFRAPRLWNLQRALVVSGLLAGCVLLGVAWIAALRRQVRRQTAQLREQMERQSRLELEVQRAARLESLGVLAGGIAHDFNNLLTIILGHLGLALMDDELPASTRHSLLQIEQGANRARKLTQQLLTFAKGGDPHRSALALSEIVRTATKAAVQGSPVRCDYHIDPELWPANVDGEQIEQAVRHLALNAVQAMSSGGVIKISLCNAELGAGENASLPAGKYVKLAITDSGEGISAEVLPQIFDPYFSTRETGRGLGLATVYSVVTKHGGRIEAESKLGHGTTFHVWLPAAGPQKVESRDLPAAAPYKKPATTARVLLMDDEASIRDLGAALLRKMGLEPVVSSDGGTAVSAFSVAQHSGKPFDLVILDLTIPGGMGGKAAMELIRKLDEKVPAIVSSGYSSDPVLADFQSYGFQAMVPKPYELNELARVINQLLGRSGSN